MGCFAAASAFRGARSGRSSASMRSQRIHVVCWGVVCVCVGRGGSPVKSVDPGLARAENKQPNSNRSKQHESRDPQVQENRCFFKRLIDLRFKTKHSTYHLRVCSVCTYQPTVQPPTSHAPDLSRRNSTSHGTCDQRCKHPTPALGR